MGEKIVKRIRGMSWTARISLMLIFTLVFSVFMYYGWYKPRIEKAEAASGDVILLWDTGYGAIPSGWTNLSESGQPFYQVFLRGAPTYGGTGGLATHTHTVTSSVSTYTADSGYKAGTSTTNKPADAHTHTPTVGGLSGSNLPSYRNLVVIRYTGVPSTLPAGIIALFDGTLPSGWTQYASQNGYYIRGEATSGGTGGNASNQHNHTITISLGAPSLTSKSGTTANVAMGTHSHTVSNQTANTVTYQPPYREVILAQKNADGSIPDGIIGLFDATPPANWTSISDVGGAFENRFLKAAATYGVSGGGGTHTHTDITGITSGASDTNGVYSGASGISVSCITTHTHTIGLTTFSTIAEVDNLPPYRDVIVAKYTAPAVQTIVDDDTSPGNKWAKASATNKAVSTFQLKTSSGTDTINSITVTRTGGADADIASSGVKIWNDVNNDNEYDAGDTSVGSCTLSGGSCTVGSLSIAIDTTAKNYVITYDISASPTNGATLQAAVTNITFASSNTKTINDTTDATITIDTAAPTTTASAGVYTFGTWTATSPVTITLSAGDGTGSGVASGYPKYCVDTIDTCSPATSYTVAFDVTCVAGSTCTQYVRYQSADNVGNTETVKSSTVKQDLQVPTTTDNTPAAWQASEITVTLTPDDGTGSGVTAATGIYGCFGTGCTPAVLGGTTMTTACGAGNECTYDVRYYSKDNVGNTESTKIAANQAKVDQKGPTSGVSFTSTPGDTTCTLNWASTTDAGSGMHATEPYEVRKLQGSDPGSCSGGSQLYIGTGLSKIDTGLTNGLIYYYRLCYKDALSNQSGYTGNPITCTPAGAACTINAPSVEILESPKTITVDNGSVTYNVRITNQDSGAACTNPLTINLSRGDSTAKFTSSIPASVSLAPNGANTTVVLTVTELIAINGETTTTTVTASAAAHPNGTNNIMTTYNTSNPLLHNSVNLSSDKWPADGGWGIAGARYGEFTCGTCHEPRATNIKGVKTSITTPDTSIATLPGDGQTITFDRVSGTAGVDPGVMGDDSDTPRDHSHRICEVCHTYDAAQTTGVNVHPYSTTDDLDNHLTADATDCTDCHKHNVAFSGAGGTCDGCHGATPSAFWTSAAHNKHFGLDEWYTAGYDDTNLTTSTYYRYNCKKCHETAHSTAPQPNITFDGGVNPPLSTGGSYAAGTCSNLYCHGNFTGGLNASPTWTGAVVCGDCHYASTGSPPSGGSHAKHAGSAGGGISLACDNCHEDTTTGSALKDKSFHVNGSADWNLKRAANTIIGLSATYSGSETDKKTPPSTTYGNCSNIYCHSDVQNDGATVLSSTYSLATWGGTVNCSTNNCHSATPATGKHTTHTAAPYSYVCSRCHNNAGDENVKHGNYNIDISINPVFDYGATEMYDGSANPTNPPANGYASCTNVYCHSIVQTTAGANLTGAGGEYKSILWNAANPGCAGCHGNPSSSGAHVKHATTYSYACTACHNAQVPPGVSTHANGAINTDIDNTYGATAAYNGDTIPGGSNYSTCSNTYCHSKGTGGTLNPGDTRGILANTSTNWGVSATCGSCHGEGVAAGRPSYASGTPKANSHGLSKHSSMSCEKCHYLTTHNGSAIFDVTKHADKLYQIDDPGTNQYYVIASYTYGLNGGTCVATYCHGTSNTPAWGTTGSMTCNTCHSSMGAGGVAAWTGKHQKHATTGTYDYSCEMCHSQGAGTVHVNGPVTENVQSAQLIFRNTGTSWTTPQSYNSSTSTYKYRSLAHDPFNGNAAITPTYTISGAVQTDNGKNWSLTDSCGTIWCHSNARPMGGTNSYKSPTWNDAAYTLCNECHSRPADGTRDWSAAHNKHLVTYSANPNITCNSCHSTVASDNITISGYTKHVDGSKDVVMNAWAGGNWASPSCGTVTGVYCHSSGEATPSYKSIAWTATTDCKACHNYTTASGTPITTGKHTTHRTTTKMTLSAYFCADCHVDTSAANNTVSSFVKHVDKARDVTILGTWDSNATTTDNYTVATKTCTNVYCHSNGLASWTPVSVTWADAAMTCKSCHYYTTASGAPITTGKHTIHRTTTKMTPSAYVCADCHVSTTASADTISSAALHIQTTKARDVTVLGTWDKDATPDNNYTVATQTCTNVYCHSDGLASWTPVSVTWGAAAMTCKSCHGGTVAGGAPIIATGKHTQHINTSNLIMTDPSCNACHVDTTADNSTIATPSKHIQTTKARDVTILGTWDSNATTTDNYTVATQTCANVYCHSNGKTVGLVYNSIAWTATITGCNVATYCHGLPPAGTTPYDHTGKTAATCITCHNHVNAAGDGFTTPAKHINKIVEAQVGCTNCHSTTQGTRRAVKGEFGLAFGHHDASVTDADCVVCHMEGTSVANPTRNALHAGVPGGNINLREPDLGTEIASGAAIFARNLGSNTLEAFAKSIQDNLCLKCHDVNGANYLGAGQTGTDGLHTPHNPFVTAKDPANVDAHFNTANASFHPVKGVQNNNYCDVDTMEIPWNVTTGTHKLITCFDCHAKDGATGNQSSTIVAHGTNESDTLRALYDAPATPSDANGHTKLCVVCHKKTVYWSTTVHALLDIGAQSQGPGFSALNLIAADDDWNAYHDTAQGEFHGCTVCHGTTTAAGVLPGRPKNAENVHGFEYLIDATDAKWPKGATETTRPYSFIRNTNTLSGIAATSGWSIGSCDGTTTSKTMCGSGYTYTYTPGGTY